MPPGPQEAHSTIVVLEGAMLHQWSMVPMIQMLLETSERNRQ